MARRSSAQKQGLEDCFAKAHEKEATPVLVRPDGTPSLEQSRQTLTQYAEALRLVGREQKVPVIDLHTNRG